MNKEQKKDLEKAKELITEAIEILTPIAEDLQEKFDNMNEGLQAMERNQRIERDAGALYDIVSELESQSSDLQDILEG